MVRSRWIVVLALAQAACAQSLVVGMSSYLGGDQFDFANAVIVDAAGNSYYAGSTSSANFPVMGAYQPMYAGTLDHDAFLLKLDPAGALVFSTYLGGFNDDICTDLAFDSLGNIVMVGNSGSPNLPMVGALQPMLVGSRDVFLVKFDPTGQTILYSTYLGGSGHEAAYGIALDAADNYYITGCTRSPDFPLQMPIRGTFMGGPNSPDVFVTKIDAAGTTLVYSTYLNGSDFDDARGIGVDAIGRATVAGYTRSVDFVTANPLQAATGGLEDAFVAQINAAGTALVYSTYLGGAGDDRALDIEVDAAGAAYLTGFTESAGFPVTPGAFQGTYMLGPEDAFVTKIAAGGASIVYSTFLGGGWSDVGEGIFLEASGAVTLTGSTESVGFPTQDPLYPSSIVSLREDAFVARLDPTGTMLWFGTHYGGSTGDDFGFDVARHPSGTIHVAGNTWSLDLPTQAPLQGMLLGATDGFIFRIDPAPPCGDCNGDQVVTILDALEAARHAVHLVTLSGLQFTKCNVIAPYEPDPAAAVNILDAYTIAAHTAGLIAMLSCL